MPLPQWLNWWQRLSKVDAKNLADPLAEPDIERAFVYDFQVSNFQMLHAWATRTLAELKTWSDLAPEAKRERALEIMDKRRPARWLEPDLEKPAADVPAMPGMYHRRRQVPPH